MGMKFRCGIVAGLAAMIVTAVPFEWSTPASARSRRAELMAPSVVPAPPRGPLFFVISLSKQQVSIYSPDGLYAKSPVSTGQPGHPTPQGIFTILNKELYHESNIYSGAPMPFMQRITYTGVAMHEGVLPGYPASHGCIRMPHDFAEWMYEITAGNERVVITQQDIVPVEITHPKLPQPKLIIEGGSALNPVDFAKLMKVRSAKEASAAEAAIGPARGDAALKIGEARAAAADYRKAEMAVAAAKAKVEGADRVLHREASDEVMKMAVAAKAAAEDKLNEAKAALETAARMKAQRDEESETAVRAVKEAIVRQQYAAGAIASWDRRLAPLSIFISRKAQRLYVRQDYRQVFDLPITIREQESPIGTHLFIAMPKDKAAGASGNTLRWLALTVPGGNEAGTRRGEAVNAAALAQTAAPSANEALDRIEIPDAVAEKLSSMVWAGAAIIVSDNAMSHETTDFARTDFVVMTGKETPGNRPLFTQRIERGARFSRGGSFFDLFR